MPTARSTALTSKKTAPASWPASSPTAWARRCSGSRLIACPEHRSLSFDRANIGRVADRARAAVEVDRGRARPIAAVDRGGTRARRVVTRCRIHEPRIGRLVPGTRLQRLGEVVRQRAREVVEDLIVALARADFVRGKVVPADVARCL